MRMKPSARVLAVGVAVAGMMCVGGGAYAVTSMGNGPAVTVTGPDHERLTITLAPGASRTFALPAANDPVRIDLDAVSVNGPAITELTCGANCVIAWLNSGNAARRTVTLKQNANTTSIRRTYVINIWY